MLDKIIHVNSVGETLDLFSLGIYVNYNNLRDFEWSAITSNDNIIDFSKGVVNKTIPFEFCIDEHKAAYIKNLFYEHFEKDIISKSAGYFIINDYRFYCYIIKSKKSKYLMNAGIMSVELEVTSDRPSWVKEICYTYEKEMHDTSGVEKLYQYRYAYTYGRSHGNASLTNDSMRPCMFKFIIYGPVSNPSVSVSGNIYNVNYEISNSEYLVIDSLKREIYVMSMSGERTNVFDRRNKESYIFEKIPIGYSLVAWSGAFGFDLIIYDERSEPKWN